MTSSSSSSSMLATSNDEKGELDLQSCGNEIPIEDKNEKVSFGSFADQPPPPISHPPHFLARKLREKIRGIRAERADPGLKKGRTMIEAFERAASQGKNYLNNDGNEDNLTDQEPQDGNDDSSGFNIAGPPDASPSSEITNENDFEDDGNEADQDPEDDITLAREQRASSVDDEEMDALERGEMQQYREAQPRHRRQNDVNENERGKNENTQSASERSREEKSFKGYFLGLLVNGPSNPHGILSNMLLGILIYQVKTAEPYFALYQSMRPSDPPLDPQEAFGKSREDIFQLNQFIMALVVLYVLTMRSRYKVLYRTLATLFAMFYIPKLLMNAPQAKVICGSQMPIFLFTVLAAVGLSLIESVVIIAVLCLQRMINS